ncbi:MAG: GGDEF domain-containing protein [Chloroflexi bacterium]|nr:GGDEF domain-containing protein [Chloroflexota bacterium]
MRDIEQFFSQNIARSFLDLTQNIVVLFDRNGTPIDWNPAFDRLKSGQPAAGLIQDFMGEPAFSQFSEWIDVLQPVQATLQLLTETGMSNFNCLLAPLPDGNFLLQAEPLPALKDQEISQLTEELVKARRLIMINKVELESVLAQADEVSHTDSLTFLSNRKRIVADLQREVSACDRYRKPVTIFMADIDHFKRINDTYGHSAGDHVLRELAGQMLPTIRQIDKLGRYGGEEFMFILPATTKRASTRIAERLLDAVRSKRIVLDDGQVVQLTISIGIAQYKIGKESWDDLLKRADKALYESKNGGRDRWTLAT